MTTAIMFTRTPDSYLWSSDDGVNWQCMHGTPTMRVDGNEFIHSNGTVFNIPDCPIINTRMIKVLTRDYFITADDELRCMVDIAIARISERRFLLY